LARRDKFLSHYVSSRGATFFGTTIHVFLRTPRRVFVLHIYFFASCNNFFVGQVGNLRPIGNRPVASSSQDPRARLRLAAMQGRLPRVPWVRQIAAPPSRKPASTKSGRHVLLKRNPSIDWSAARAAIEQTRERLESAQIPAEDRERIFRQRATALARPSVALADSERQQRIMVFHLGEERCALPLSDVVEVISGAAIAPVPGAPAYVAGVIQVRGEIRPVFRLGQLLGTAVAESSDTVALVRRRNHEVGLRIGRVEDIRTVSEADLQQGPAGNPRIQYVTADLVLVLHLDALLDESREAESS
jgi:chemotaxis signal transduction protein